MEDALHQKFTPELIPDILEEWSIKQDGKLGCELVFNGLEFDWFYFKNNRDLYDYQYADKQHRRHSNPKTLNDFLADLQRASIKATFTAKFIEKHGLK